MHYSKVSFVLIPINKVFRDIFVFQHSTCRYEKIPKVHDSLNLKRMNKLLIQNKMDTFLRFKNG